MNSFILTNPTNKALKLLVYQTKHKNWSHIKLRHLSASHTNLNNENVKTASSQEQPPKRSGSSGVFKFFAFAVTGFTIGLGYVTLNPDSRKQIESFVPQSSQLFDFIDEKLNFKLPSPKETIKQPEKVKEQIVNVPEVKSPSVPVIAPKPVENKEKLEKKAPTKATAPTTAVETVEQKTDWKNALKSFELQEEATLDALENKIRLLSTDVKLKTSEALNSSYAAIESLNKYKNALRNALDDKNSDETKDIEWRHVTDLFDLQAADLHEANQKFTLAKNQMEELDTLLKQIKTNQMSKDVKNFRNAQIDLINQHRLLQAEQLKLSEAKVHANVLRSYTNEQKAARNQFLKEIQSLQPEGITSLNKTSGELSNEEINSLLIHAHKRVLQLQKQIEKNQIKQNQQVQKALEDQKKQIDEFQKNNEASLYELHKKEFELEKEKIIETEKLKTNELLGKELSRQAAAHNSHLAQMLRIQQEELTSIYDKKLIEDKEKIKNEFYNKVAESFGKMRGIESALNARANLELQANNAKQLWLAVQSLEELIHSKAENVLSSNNELIEIKANVEKIKNSAPNNEFIQTIVKSIPDNAIKNGIWSEPDLKNRFYYLKKICNRVALIDERGGSLFKYFISYLQSFFIMHTKIDTKQLEKSNNMLQLDNLDLNTFTLLDYAQYYIENGNIEYAVRLVQQLKGEPARLAKDWLKEAITLLEIKQASALLTAYISSIYIGTNFD